MEKITTVLFDLDGTLLDRELSIMSFIKNQYERLHTLFPYVSKTEYIKTFLELDCNGLVWKDVVYAEMIKKFEINVSVEFLLTDYIAEFKNHCIAFSHLQPMIEQLKKNSIRVGIITNGREQFQKSSIRALGIENDIETIVISEAVGMKKPDLAIFEWALKEMNVSAEECLYVGDHPLHDIFAAKSAGMKTAWKINGLWEYAEADYWIHDLMEIPELLESKNRVSI
ncbi:HAD family hydrolase [Peribacillus alkalitolerans]|uniref:HAD family hydrolase n=1 Tax=Peribacillus alkalitolerans TaxID=1550385 RepID=UPI001F081B30|nr:HAD-IIIA family hydrolase [Peribacillus alkalitolerans]